MKYKFKVGWKRWKQGQIIDQYEYNRLPPEMCAKLVEKVNVESREDKVAVEPEIIAKPDTVTQIRKAFKVKNNEDPSRNSAIDSDELLFHENAKVETTTSDPGKNFFA